MDAKLLRSQSICGWWNPSFCIRLAFVCPVASWQQKGQGSFLSVDAHRVDKVDRSWVCWGKKQLISPNRHISGTTLLLRLSGTNSDTPPAEPPNATQAVPWLDLVYETSRQGQSGLPFCAICADMLGLDMSWLLKLTWQSFLLLFNIFTLSWFEEAFLALMGRKRLCVLRFLGPSGGTLRLMPKKDEAEAIKDVSGEETGDMLRTKEEFFLSSWLLAW